MLRRRQINADPGASRLRSLLSAAAAPLRRVAWAVEDRLWSGRALLGEIADAARWPFERLAWTVERRLLWPLSERTAGWSPPVGASPPGGPSSPARRATVGAALGATAGVAILVGVLVLSGDGEEGARRQAAAPVSVAAPAPPPGKPAAEKPQGPTLQGAPPSFGVGKGVGVAKQGGGNSGDATATDSAAPRTSTLESDDGGATGGAERGATASSSRAKPVPAGPAAMRVARRFAEAFVFYEIGKRPARAKTVFGETATPALAEALSERPPRLPAGARVPKARVVNLVPGPRLGRTYTVSVSLLRVGLTSELRLAMLKRHGGWLVTDVRG
jgi:hypothetical protein